ncbi:MAG: c-type cytochrome domain-containing protein, partial [Verrucomicrobiota bacterium]
MRTTNILRGALICMGLTLSAEADEKLNFFESKIRPVFAEKCYGCHSLKAAEQGQLKGDFYIDMREGLLRGGESGPAVIPGQPEKSLLMKVIRHEIVDMQMPPKKAKLSDRQIADMETWIKDGCTDPRTGQP